MSDKLGTNRYLPDRYWPLLASLILLILLGSSVAYWGMQFTQTTQAEPTTQEESTPIDTSTASSLFGGDGSTGSTAGNYQLLGVLVGNEASTSIAILSTDGLPGKAFRVGQTISPGLALKEVHEKYALVTEGGILKRLNLPEYATNKTNPTAPPRPVTAQQEGVPPAPPQATEEPPQKE